ncbi:MAG: FxLYD domain-containing protein, partial [Candidatus Bathyarchaeota archaeon]
MKSKALALNLIILSLILVQTASASAPIKDIITLGEITVTGKGRIVPNYGYYVYGEVSNTQLYNIKNVIVEVTTYDQSDAVIDTQTAMVRPTIIDSGTKAPFLVISTKPPQVYREEIKIKSYERTEESNFPYIELTDISEVFNGGVTGTVSNTHPNINLYEAEIIATFYNYNGEIWDIQSYGVNNYAQFNAGDTEDFTIQSDLLTSYTVNLVTQCNMYYREPTLEMTFSNYTPVKDQQMTLNFTVYPNLPGQPIDVT